MKTDRYALAFMNLTSLETTFDPFAELGMVATGS
jgi:hypothetical protein